MRHLKYLLIFFCVIALDYTIVRGQCPKVIGTIQISDTFSIKATEISVYDYTSFIVANNYDITLFPDSTFIESQPYRELFTDLRNRRHNRFLKGKGKDPYTYYFVKVKGSSKEKKQQREWFKLPMSGISRDLADKYCIWLGKFYGFYANRYKHSCDYEIRLPTEDELKLAFQIKGIVQNSKTDKQSSFRFVAIIHSR